MASEHERQPPQRMRVFDRGLVRRRRERLARGFAEHGFLVREVADRLADRLADVRRAFPRALVLGGEGRLAAATFAGRFGVELLVVADGSAAMLAGCPAPAVVADEEALPFAADSLDLALGLFTLHWVNDLPGTLAQLRRCLAPDGLLLLALAGGETLIELRRALTEAELEVEGGASPRVSPFADVRDAGSLLQRAGFALPVVDSDRIAVRYADPLRLMRELSAMGEGNALLRRRPGPLRRATLARAGAIYRERFGGADDGRVPATFEILFLTAWKPHAGQPKPLPRGSGRVDLAEALRATGEGRGPG